MTTRNYSSISQETTLTTALTNVATTMVVNSATALLSGITITSGQTFTVVIDPDTALEEIVDVVYPSSVSSTTLTIARNIDGSVAIAHSAGAAVRHMATGRDFREANTHINGTLAQHAATTSLELKTLISDDTGSGSLVFATSPTLVTPVLGTVAAGSILTNATGLPLTTGVTGTLPVANGGTGVTTSTGSGNNVLSTSPTLVTPVLGTVAAGSVLTNATGLPITTGVSGLGTGVATFLATPTTANLAAAVTGETGTGALVFGTSPTIDAPTLTGTALATTLTASGTVTANSFSGPLSGAVTGNASTATALATGRTISLTGDVTGTTGSFDGTGNATMVATIATGIIENADISATAGISYSKLSLNGLITSSDIATGTIVAADIADATITAAKMVTDPYARANHTGTQTASTVSDFDTQVRTNRLDQMAAPTAAVALNAQKITGLGTPTANTTDAATTAYVDTAVANLVNSAPGTLDTLGEIATAIQAGGTVFDAMVLKAGSTMTGALTLSGAPTVGLHAATKTYVDTVAGSATAAATSAAAAEASYDSFDDRYLGAKATAPTLDNDGNALITGAIYWNTPGATMYAWTGSAWGSISSSAEIYRYRFTATGGETSKSGADDSSQTLVYIAGKEQVYLNGVLLVRGQDYTATNGTSITGLAALAASDVLEIITFTALSVVTDIPQSVVDAKGDLVVGTAADTVGRLAVGTNGYYLQADSTAGTGLVWSAVSGYSAPTIGSTAINSGATVTTIAGLTLTSPALTTPTISTYTTAGDLVYGSGSGVITRLGVGSSAQVLTVAGGVPTWAAAATVAADNDQPILASQIFG